ncbi:MULTISPECIES: hypothetical protein [unclassified Mycobacterium]|uniref:LppU/SCO3897 family protein n=1 Tax=unclassified Mycobacterium TaxID=2642494 RepID=UPI0007FF72AB|nr:MULTISPECIES: hypothetical protein [unclassified Mycobacterium]OBG73123.1 hypothetical protein A5700_07575 [Mycobacterium sp. E1214]OBH26266.1 hypothetical protein A5693_03825 [Mycobacterium sp. E1319]
MHVAYLASTDSTAELAGRLMFTIGLPAIGLVCLIIGLVERSRSRRRSAALPPPYQAGYPYPPAPPPGYPGAYSYPGYPPPRPPASKTAGALITVGIVLLGLGGLDILSRAATALSKHRTAPATGAAATTAGPQIGQCFSEFEVGAGKLDSPTSCADPVATYELAAKVGPSASCPDGKRDGSVYARLRNDSATLCFAANFIQGRCYLQTEASKTTTWTPADCGQAQYRKFTVERRVDGSTDTTQCPPETHDIAYPVPPRVYCLARSDS